MGHRYATPPTCSSGWRYCGEPATLAGRHVAAYLFQNFPSPLLQLFVVVEPEHSGEGRFHHVRLVGAVVETVHFHLFLEGSGERWPFAGSVSASPAMFLARRRRINRPGPKAMQSSSWVPLRSLCIAFVLPTG